MKNLLFILVTLISIQINYADSEYDSARALSFKEKSNRLKNLYEAEIYKPIGQNAGDCNAQVWPNPTSNKLVIRWIPSNRGKCSIDGDISKFRCDSRVEKGDCNKFPYTKSYITLHQNRSFTYCYDRGYRRTNIKCSKYIRAYK